MTSSSKSNPGAWLEALKSNVAHVRRLDRRGLADLVRAAFELALARFRLRSVDARELLSSSQGLRTFVAAQPGNEALNRIVDRVSFAIPRMGSRVPWRANCLVQALAARHWLAKYGIETELVLGVREGEPLRLDAHAWLKSGERIVTGGQVDGYQPFIRPVAGDAEANARLSRAGSAKGRPRRRPRASEAAP